MSRILVDQIRSNSASGDAITLDGNGKCAINATTINSLTFPTSDGSANQLIKTNGSGTLSFETVSAGITMADSWRITSSFSVGSGSNDITSNWERDDNNFEKIGTGLTESSGIFSFPATGIYEVKAHSMFYTGGGTNTPYAGIALQGTTDNSSYSSRAAAYSSQSDDLGTARYHNVHASAIFDVTDTSNVKFKITTFKDVNYGDCAFMGDSGDNYTYVEVIRLGDT